jgi:hypothetical protein
MKAQAVLKYLTCQPVLRKQIRPLKRRFHAASLRGSCGSPLGSTSNPKKTHKLRKREPRKPEGGRGQVKSQLFRNYLDFANKLRPKICTFPQAGFACLETINVSAVALKPFFH